MPELESMHGLEIYHNILSKESCEKIIDLFDNDDKREEGSTGRNKVSEQKRSTDIHCNFANPETKDYNDILMPSVIELSKRIKKTYQFLNKQCDYWHMDNWYNIQKYEDGQGYFATHCEQSSSYPNRMMAWMIYLNDAKCGTEFPYQKTTVNAEQGKGVVWSAGWTHPHKGVTPNIGEKYIATGWAVFYKPQKKI